MRGFDWSVPFDELEEGTSFRSRGRTVTEADVVAFAALTGDWHPQHTDTVWAGSSRFGERVAHGMLIVSYAVGLVPFDPERVVALRRISEVVFKRPVRMNTTIGVEGRVRALRALDEQTGLVSFAWAILDESGRTVCRAVVDVLWARANAGPPPHELGESEGPEFPAGVIPC